VAKRAKRASHINPRQDRNFPKYPAFRNTRGYQNYSDNVIDFPNTRGQKRVELVPRNLSQEAFLAALENPKTHIIFATGPAGVGKSFMATLMALKKLSKGEIKRIVITRPNIAVDDKDVGFLPGDLIKKLSPWCMPILEIIGEYFSQKEIIQMLEESVIELLPIAFIRGRTLKDAFIILDEAQNTTPSSMLSVLTRIGEGSKMVVTGDIKQSDRGMHNGLTDFLGRFKTSEQIEVVHFDKKDVSRHPVIKEILELYGQE
jgi:phosphate starvation-inducible PhoH-like protein